MTKNADPDKCLRYAYSKCGIGFDICICFSLSGGGSFGKNVIIFGADVSPFEHINSKKKDILILHKGLPGGLHDTTVTAEKKYPINFTEQLKKFVSVCIIMEVAVIHLLLVLKPIN